MTYQVNSNIDTLQSFIMKKNFNFSSTPSRIPYDHMGATLSDAILQSGMNYNNIVYPRILLFRKKYSTFRTTSSFIALFNAIPLEKILNWNNCDKIDRITNISLLLFCNKVENENDLKCWIDDNCNTEKLKKIRGIGPKTIDYIKLLVGLPAIPIDRHLFKFLELAKLKTSNYDDASQLYISVSRNMGINLSDLDYQIWNYMLTNDIKHNE